MEISSILAPETQDTIGVLTKINLYFRINDLYDMETFQSAGKMSVNNHIETTNIYQWITIIHSTKPKLKGQLLTPIPILWSGASKKPDIAAMSLLKGVFSKDLHIDKNQGLLNTIFKLKVNELMWIGPRRMQWKLVVYAVAELICFVLKERIPQYY